MHIRTDFVPVHIFWCEPNQGGVQPIPTAIVEGVMFCGKQELPSQDKGDSRQFFDHQEMIIAEISTQVMIPLKSISERSFVCSVRHPNES